MCNYTYIDIFQQDLIGIYRMWEIGTWKIVLYYGICFDMEHLIRTGSVEIR